MTAHILTSELNALIQDSKRKSPEIKTAAERSLSDLKSLSNTSEAQTAADLKRRPHFVQPFVQSCMSKNPKFASTSIACLQRLVVVNALHDDSLNDVLNGLRACTSLNQDIQLKILQVLPSLLQNYARLVTGELLTIALQICFSLLASKASVISNTAAASLQQLVVSVFDKVQLEDETSSDDFILDVPSEGGDISVHRSALDAYRLLNDLCLLAEGQSPEHLEPVTAGSNFCLELIEATFSNHAEVICAHPEQMHILRLRFMPFMIRALSDRIPFSMVVRLMRLVPLVLSNLLDVLATECEVLLSLLNHMLDHDASASWKRVLCMEGLRNIHLDPGLIRRIYILFDAQEGKRNIVRDQISRIAQLASEKPAVIGLGQYSTVPANDQGEDGMDQMAALQAEGISGTIGVGLTLKSSAASGISAKLSSMRIPCLEQLDKIEAPAIPPAYIYSLSLNCLNSFSEGLAKFLLPFTVPGEKSRRRTRVKDDISSSRERDDRLDPRPQATRAQSNATLKVPVNPLTLEKHVHYRHIEASAGMVSACWSAVLAAYSTFFRAALDNEHYRDLVRSFQKYAQVAALLRLQTPRDAFLTALGKSAVPHNLTVSHDSAVVLERRSQDRQSSETQSLTLDRDVSTSDYASASLNSRNLLCLRALLNLGIALGPVLDTAWTIVFQTLQQAEIIIERVHLMRSKSRSSKGESSGNGEYLGDIGDQISAVDAAAERMLESTGDLPDEPYVEVLASVCSLLQDVSSGNHRSSNLNTHKRQSSVTASQDLVPGNSRLNQFVVNRLDKLIQYNGFRLLQSTAEETGWPLVIRSLQQVASGQNYDDSLRIQAVKVLIHVVGLTTSPDLSEELAAKTRLLGLTALKDQISTLYPKEYKQTFSPKSCEVEIHCLLLEELQTCLQQYGDSLGRGWPEVLDIVNSVFAGRSEINPSRSVATLASAPETSKIPGSKLIRTSFLCLQLICSEFMRSLPGNCYLTLLDTVSSYCRQKEEFNVSLTSTTLPCGISDHLWEGQSTIQLHDSPQPPDDDEPDVQSEAFRLYIWYRLLQTLGISTTDSRAEVRQGAIHSIFRTLDTCGELLSAQAWVVLQRSVLLPMLQNIEARYQDTRTSKPDESETIQGWNDSSIMFLDNLSTILSSNLGDMLGRNQFPLLWQELIEYLQALLDRKSLAVSSSVYLATAKILSGAPEKDFDDYVVAMRTLWEAGNPVHHAGVTRKKSDNQAALIAYTRCFLELYAHLPSNELQSSTSKALDQLIRCVVGSSPMAYAGDIDALTPLQSLIIESVDFLRGEDPNAIQNVTKALARLGTTALQREEISTGEAKSPTFIAFSKASLELLGHHITSSKTCTDLYTKGALVECLKALNQTIESKYSAQQQGKEPQLWKKATQVLVNILEAVVKQLISNDFPETCENDVWRTIISCYTSIISNADEDANTAQHILLDEDFDIQSFSKIHDLIIPSLGALHLDDDLPKLFARTLLENSFVFEPHPDDLPEAGEGPLDRIASIHIGRTNDLEPSPRSKMSYEVTEKLFDLVAVCDSSPERIRLAQAAIPFFTLRVSLVLKAYVLDQPLRGRMPQPAAQRKELLHILSRVLHLNSEPKALPDVPQLVSLYKKHLISINGLIVKSLGVVGADNEVRVALMRVLEQTVVDFGG